MKTRLAPAAARDLTEILHLLAEQSPAAAKGFRDRLKAVRRFIGDYPGAGRKTDDPKLFYVNTGNYPYLVFFEMSDAQVVIMRILHGARDPATMPARPSKPSP